MNSGADGARTSSRALPEPPLTKAGVAAYAGVLAAYEITVSGPVPEGSTTGAVTYFVIDKVTSNVLGHIVLPNASTQVHGFSIILKVAALADAYDVGVFGADGRFVSSGFAVEAPPRGAVGAAA
jgi:hypothetical protein